MMYIILMLILVEIREGSSLQCFTCNAVDKIQCLATQLKTTCDFDGKSTGQCMEMTYSSGEKNGGVYMKRCLKSETSCQELCRNVEMVNHVANCKISCCKNDLCNNDHILKRRTKSVSYSKSNHLNEGFLKLYCFLMFINLIFLLCYE